MADDNEKDWKALYHAKVADYDKLETKAERLEAENTRRKSEYKDKLADLTQKLEKFEGQPADLKAEVNRLKGELTTIRHKDGFKILLADKELGLNPSVSPERLMKLLDYKPEGDEFDAKAVRKAVVGLRETDEYLFSAPAEQREPAGTSLPAWAGRGGSAEVTTGSVVTESQQRDPSFMYGYGAKK